MLEIEFKSLSEYLDGVSEIVRAFGCHQSDLWFRGIKDENMQLVPGVIWRNINSTREESLISEFLTYCNSYSNNIPDNKFELYSLMQHYGLPTRLLDWSLSPLISLFFSLEQENNSATRVVWVIHPNVLNEKSIDFKGVVAPNNFRDTMINSYLPKYLRNGNELSPDPPVAISLPLNNQRVKSQKGMFTLHGFSKKPLDKFYEEYEIPQIAKLKLKSENLRNKILDDIYCAGIKEDDVYQDLNSLSKRIMREFGI